MSGTQFESGLRDIRAHWVAESDPDTTPTDPAWKRFSDVVGREAVSTAVDANIEEQRGVGSPDPVNFFRGVEDDTLAVPYDLQRWLSDGGSPELPQDPVANAMMRDTVGAIHECHSVLIRHTQTEGGVDDAGVRTYTYARGCLPDTGTLVGNPGSSLPILATVQYMAAKIRSYEIHQPADATTITVNNANAADDGLTVTIEDEGAATSEAVTTDAAVPPTTTATFDNIDAVWVSDDHEGDITIEDDAGNVLMTIPGASSYQDIEGDRGVPLLGGGSFEAALGTAFEHFLGDTLQLGGADLADTVSSFQFQVSNNVEADPRNQTLRQRLTAGNRNIEVTADVFGERQSHADFLRHLQVQQGDLIWTLTGGTITALQAALTDVGDRDYSEGQTKIQLSNTFTGEDLAIATA